MMRLLALAAIPVLAGCGTVQDLIGLASTGCEPATGQTWFVALRKDGAYAEPAKSPHPACTAPAAVSRGTLEQRRLCVVGSGDSFLLLYDPKKGGGFAGKMPAHMSFPECARFKT